MPYTPNTWVARQGTDLNRFQDQDGNFITLTQAPTEVITQGTPFSADWMNHIEQGIAENSALLTPVLIPNNSDLDDYSDNGTYYNGTTANTSNIANIPEKLAFWMDVKKTGSAGWATQRILFPTNGHEYIRYYSSWSAAWTNWVMIGGVDCVISQGTSGIWHFEKWRNGKAECWGKATVSGTFTLVKNSWYAITDGSWTTINFPSGLFIASPECNITGHLSSNWNYPLGWIGNLSASALEFLPVLAGQSSSSVTVSYHIRAVGTWK